MMNPTEKPKDDERRTKKNLTVIAAGFLIGAIAFVGFTLSPTVSYAAEGDNPRPNDGIVGCVEAGDTGEAASTRATT